MASCVEAAVEVLRTAGEPLQPTEIYARAAKAGLWTSSGRSPERTLAVQMARASVGYTGSRPTKGKLFIRLEDGRYDLAK